MNFFDIIVIVILGYCLIRGVFRGFIKELSSIIGVLGGFYAAFTYYMVVAKPLSKWIANSGYLNILSFLIIFCGVFIMISILGVIINYLLKIVFLGWLDRHVLLVSEKMAKIVPKDMKHAFSDKIATIKKAWEKNK